MRESNLLMLKDEVSPFSWTRRFRKWDRKIEEYEDKNFFQVIYLILWNNKHLLFVENKDFTSVHNLEF
jgi:hypothetical protein